MRAVLSAAAVSFAYPPTRGSCSLQEKLSQMAPFPTAAVLIEQPGDTLESAAARMRQMRAEGFTAVKQILLAVDVVESAASYLNRTKAWFGAALDAGLSPWWYERGGWECFTQELLAELSLPLDAPPWELEAAPRMIAYQAALQRRRVDSMNATPVFNLGEPGAGGVPLPPALVPAFAQWLEGEYGAGGAAAAVAAAPAADDAAAGDAAVDSLLAAWADPYRSNSSARECADWAGCAALLAVAPGGWPSHDYRRYRDALRFQADALLQRLNATIAALRAADADAPVRTGGASLQLNQAAYAWDLWAQGDLARAAGSFYISSHLPWHYAGFQHEVDRPVIFEVSVAVAVAEAAGAWPGACARARGLYRS
jgi:hypothetical protein